MGNILESIEEFPWECTENNGQKPYHLLWVILSAVSVSSS